MTDDTAASPRAILGGWPGVTDADKPLAGWSIIPERPSWGYLADPLAVRLANEHETAALPHLYASYDPWRAVAALAEDGIELARAVLTAPIAHVVGPIPAASPVPVIPFGPIASLAAERIAEDGAVRAQRAAETLAAYQAASSKLLHYAEQDAAARADATLLILAVSAETESIPAVTDEGGQA